MPFSTLLVPQPHPPPLDTWCPGAERLEQKTRQGAGGTLGRTGYARSPDEVRRGRGTWREQDPRYAGDEERRGEQDPRDEVRRQGKSTRAADVPRSGPRLGGSCSPRSSSFPAYLVPRLGRSCSPLRSSSRGSCLPQRSSCPATTSHDLANLALPDVPRSRRTSSHDLTALVLPDVPRTWRTLSPRTSSHALADLALPDVPRPEPRSMCA